jgi:hypothetical protein
MTLTSTNFSELLSAIRAKELPADAFFAGLDFMGAKYASAANPGSRYRGTRGGVQKPRRHHPYDRDDAGAPDAHTDYHGPPAGYRHQDDYDDDHGHGAESMAA